MENKNLLIGSLIVAVVGVGGILGAGIFNSQSQNLLSSFNSFAAPTEDPKAMQYMGLVRNIEGRRIQSIVGKIATLEGGERLEFENNSGCEVGDYVDSYTEETESLYCRDSSGTRRRHFRVWRRHPRIQDYLFARTYLGNNGYNYDSKENSYKHSSGREYEIKPDGSGRNQAVRSNSGTDGKSGSGGDGESGKGNSGKGRGGVSGGGKGGSGGG